MTRKAIFFQIFLILSVFSAFPKKNEKIQSLFKETLSNGIPLIVKNNPGKLVEVRLVFEGGVLLLNEDSAGLDRMTVELMLSELNELADSDGFSTTASFAKDFSALGFRCVDTDFEGVLRSFSEKIVSPNFTEAGFSGLVAKYKGTFEKETNISSILSDNLRETIFKNHPYGVSQNPTPRSIEKITFSDIIDWHEKLLDSSRIKIFVAGEFIDSSTEKSADESEKFAKIETVRSLFEEIFAAGEKMKRSDLAIPKVQKIDFEQNENIVAIPTDKAEDDFYAMSYFKVPGRYDSDYAAFAIATMILDEIFLDISREKICESAGIGISGGKEIVGIISVYKTRQNIYEIMDDVLESFPAERELKFKLKKYKREYIHKLYDTNKTISGLLSNIVLSYEYSDSDPEKYLLRPDEVEGVKASQIVAAYKKYFKGKENSRKWIVVASEENLNRLSEYEIGAD